MTCLIMFCTQESFPWGYLPCKLVEYNGNNLLPQKYDLPLRFLGLFKSGGLPLLSDYPPPCQHPSRGKLGYNVIGVKSLLIPLVLDSISVKFVCHHNSKPTAISWMQLVPISKRNNVAKNNKRKRTRFAVCCRPLQLPLTPLHHSMIHWPVFPRHLPQILAYDSSL